MSNARPWATAGYRRFQKALRQGGKYRTAMDTLTESERTEVRKAYAILRANAKSRQKAL